MRVILQNFTGTTPGCIQPQCLVAPCPEVCPGNQIANSPTYQQMLYNMTVGQLHGKVAMYNDIISMMNAGASNAAIGTKYGFYPDSMAAAQRDLKSFTDELAKRNIDPPQPNVSTGSIGKVHSWLPIIALATAAALIIYLMFFSKD